VLIVQIFYELLDFGDLREFIRVNLRANEACRSQKAGE